MSETGTLNNVIVDMRIETNDRWLISYGADPDVGLLWHEIRMFANEDTRLALGKKLTDAGIAWEMLNLSSVEREEPWTIEQYIESVKRP